MAPGISNGHMTLRIQGRDPDIFGCKYLEER